MGLDLRYRAARAVTVTVRWLLRSVLGRTGAQLPGRLGCALDPRFIAHLMGEAKGAGGGKGVSGASGVKSVIVVGTNGKTTTTAFIARALAAAGHKVCTNHTGANLASGIAGALLDVAGADWAVLECDELWTRRVVPQVQPDYFVLLDLFRDQLDRMGEIDIVQNTIAEALAASPATTLVYNADDPFCAGVALKLAGAGNATVGFGVAEDLHASGAAVSDSDLCHLCGAPLTYELRQYSQLGRYTCENCGFAHPGNAWESHNIFRGENGVRFVLADQEVTAPVTGAYMVYNLTAAAALLAQAGEPLAALNEAMEDWHPVEGRQQRVEIDGRTVLVNLAKNPAGLSQSLALTEAVSGPVAVAITINDNDADGHDVSWLWDVDFSALAARARAGEARVFAGGTRREDLAVRLKYAGIRADLVADTADVLARLVATPDMPLYLFPNYTALAGVVADVARLVEQGLGAVAADAAAGESVASPAPAPETAPSPVAAEAEMRPLRIVHVLPGLLNLYGDGGNAAILAARCAWRGIPVEVAALNPGDSFDAAAADLILIGGGPDFEQRCAAAYLEEWGPALRAYAEDGGVILAICGGYQMLGTSWNDGAAQRPGLGIFPMETRRGHASTQRLVGHVALDSALSSRPVIGYENHSSETVLDPAVPAAQREAATLLGTIHRGTGHGNDASATGDGCVVNHAVGTYLHGPVLSKNPELADSLLAWALERRARLEGGEDAPSPTLPLAPLDDAEEHLASNVLLSRVVRH